MLWLVLALGCRNDVDDRTLLVPGPAANVLMVSIDTLRRDGLRRYGGSGDMPFLDAWFDQAVALDDHVSCSNWTYSSMICALTGATPVDVGFLPLDGQGPQPWPAPVPLLSERLAAEGFATALFSASYMLSNQLGTDRGYDHVNVEPDAPGRTLLPQALAWLENAAGQDQPWFLHVHLVDPHGPYDPPLDRIPEWDGPAPLPWDLRRAREFSAMRDDWKTLDDATQAEVLRQARLLYAGERRQVDADLGQWMAQVLDLGGLDDTVTVILSDHGEQFAEHGRWFHGTTLYAEEVDAIAGFQAPGLAPLAFKGPTWHVDLVPTLLSTLGLAPATEPTGTAAGLAPPDRIRSVLRYDRSTEPKQLLVEDGWRLHYSWSGQDALYDTLTDPGERHDLSASAYRDAARLWRVMDSDVAALDGLQELYEPQPTW